MDFVGELANLGVAAAALVGAGWASLKWHKRPKFICGIPPSIAERSKDFDRKRLGEDSVATAFKHAPHCFAERFRRPHQEDLSQGERRRLLADRERTRTIAPDEYGRARILILIANSGKRVADYSATMTFYAKGGKVHVTDVVTETAPVYLYADRPELVAEGVRCADWRIVEGYDAYLMDEEMRRRRWGDVVVLSGGHLEAGLFELVVVDVVIEDDFKDNPEGFFVVFTVDCTDGWTGARTFIQGCRVSRDGSAAAVGRAS